jgi:hypothetical protein
MDIDSLNSLPAHYKWSVAAREMEYRRLRTSKQMHGNPLLLI